MPRRVESVFECAAALGLLLGLTASGGWAEEAAREAPSGYHLVAQDSGGGRDKHSHLRKGIDYYFGPGLVPVEKVAEDDPARNILYDFGAVEFGYRGLAPSAKYKVRVEYLSDHPNGERFPTRVVRLKAFDTLLQEKVALPEDEVVSYMVDLPAETYRDGTLNLSVERVEGHNAVVSAVEIWSTDAQGMADVQPASIFGSDMVLQRGRSIPVWGEAEAGQDVTVAIAGNEARTKTDSQGNWRVRLPAMEAGGPHVMTVSGKRTVTFGNVLVGEVWVCSGQSNMEMKLGPSGPKTSGYTGVADYESVLAGAELPRIRLFESPNVWAAAPERHVQSQWRVCDATAAASFSAVGFIFGHELLSKLDVPIGLIDATVGGSPIEDWNPSAGAHFYKAMVHPIIPYAFRGVIWYQGETNLGDGIRYFEKMQQLVDGWRREWGQGQFPFYFVQLAPYKYGDGWPVAKATPTLLPKLWEAQRAALSIPNTGMVVTTDLGDIGDIHPRRKKEVGQRLALWALAKTYGHDIVYSGPLYSHYTIEGNRIVVQFDHTGSGLASRDGEALDWFVVAGSDKKFVPAKASIQSDTVVVSSADVVKPVAVRFAWDQVAQPNLINKEGLPASPFRTDDWSDDVPIDD